MASRDAFVTPEDVAVNAHNLYKYMTSTPTGNWLEKDVSGQTGLRPSAEHDTDEKEVEDAPRRRRQKLHEGIRRHYGVIQLPH